MATIDSTGRLLKELNDIDTREDAILAALLQRLAASEALAQRDRSVTVADLQALKTALDDVQSKVAKAQAAAVAAPAPTNGVTNGVTNGAAKAPAQTPAPAETPPAAVAPAPVVPPAAAVSPAPVVPPPSVAPTAPVVPPTLEELAAQIHAHDAATDQLREALTARLQAVVPAVAEPAPAVDHAVAPLAPGASRPRTFRLQQPLMHGTDVRTFQRLLNHRFEGWGIGKRIPENGTYGPQTRQAASQVAYALGLLPADLAQGITPGLRILIHRPSRRTPEQLQRANERQAYRASLRKKHAHVAPRRGTAKAPTTQAPASGGALAAAIREHGGRWEDVIVREATRSKVPVSLVCAVLEKESGFTNVFGHDPTIFAGAGTVTKEKYLEYKRRRGPGGRGGMQGVGPMQLTWFSFQDEADKLGGCWMPGANIRVGVAHLAANIRENGLADGVRRYNGSGAAALAYSRDVLKRKQKWDAWLAGAKAAPAKRPASARPPATSKGTSTARPKGKAKAKGTLTPRGKALHWLTVHRGITEQGKNRDNRKDGITAAQKRIGAWLVGEPWCGVWCANAALKGGVRIKSPGRWASVAFIEDDARSRTNGFRGWTTDPKRVLRADLVVIGGRGKHVETVRKVSRVRRIVLTDGGNTSPGKAGSQSNGEGAYLRRRSFGEVHGYALVGYPDA